MSIQVNNASEKTVKQDDITYSINEHEKTATVINCKTKQDDLIFPVSIWHESNEYILTSIASRAFFFSTVRSVSFSPKSKLRTFAKDAIQCSNIERLTIPASCVELEEGWCSATYNLRHVEVESGNPRYSSVDDKCIIGKSDTLSESFDTLVICARGFVKSDIPETIRTIGPYAFSKSYLESITIPSHITRICNHAFSDCSSLVRVEFQPNSELQAIEKDAFSGTKIKSIRIPASVVELEDGWCSETEYLMQVEVESGNARYMSVDGKCIIGKSDILSESYDMLVICARDTIEFNIPPTIKIIGVDSFSYSALENITIPSNVTQICQNSFYRCSKLSRVVFGPNSELRTIGECAFICTNIESITIPSHVTQICEKAFSSCSQLDRVEFEPNSELQSIGKEAFIFSKIQYILIPASVKQIGEMAFAGCQQLNRVEFEPNSELQTICKGAFSESSVARLTIPASVVELEELWGCATFNLCHVEVESGNTQYMSVGGKYIISKSDKMSESFDKLIFCCIDVVKAKIPETIKIIGSYAFNFSNLRSVSIPPHVTQICGRAFNLCQLLYQIEFQPNSELKTIAKEAFFSTKLSHIRIPASVVELEDGWCSGTKHLIQVEVESGNARYSSIDGKCIIGKSDTLSESYDTLVICARDAIKFNIPPTIKIIGPDAFAESFLENITIPSHVTQICQNSFYHCSKLSRVVFKPNSELRTIKEYAFAYSDLESITIPSHVTQICESAFHKCSKLTSVEFQPNSQLRAIKAYAFANSNIKSIQIPAPVTQIYHNAFLCCNQLQLIEIDENSVNESINKSSFIESAYIMIPVQKKHILIHNI